MTVAHVEIRLREGVPQGAGPVDRTGGRYKSGLIRGVRLMKLGEFTESGGLTFRVDDASLASMLACCAGRADGVPVHLTHAAAWGADGVLHQIGEVYDVHAADGTLFGDIHLGPDAAKLPMGDMADWAMTRAEARPHSFGMSFDMRGQLRVPTQDDPNTTPFFECSEVRSADIVGRPATKERLLSEGEKTPMANDPKSVEMQLSELRAAADAAKREAAEAVALLAAEREKTKATEQRARAVSVRARFDAAVAAGQTVPAFRDFWCGEHSADGTPVMIAASDGKQIPKHIGWGVAHPEMFEQFLALSSPAQRGAEAVAGSVQAAPAQSGNVVADYDVALEAAKERLLKDDPSLGGPYLLSQARSLVATEQPALHAAHRMTIPGRLAAA